MMEPWRKYALQRINALDNGDSLYPVEKGATRLIIPLLEEVLGGDNTAFAPNLNSAADGAVAVSWFLRNHTIDLRFHPYVVYCKIEGQHGLILDNSLVDGVTIELIKRILTEANYDYSTTSG